jgi:hypothetical protein
MHTWVRQGSRTFKLKMRHPSHPLYKFNEQLFDGTEDKEFIQDEKERLPFFVGSFGIWPDRETLKECESRLGVVAALSPLSGTFGGYGIYEFTGPKSWKAIHKQIDRFNNNPKQGAYRGYLRTSSGKKLFSTFKVIQIKDRLIVQTPEPERILEVPNSGCGWFELHTQENPPLEVRRIWMGFYKSELLWKEDILKFSPKDSMPSRTAGGLIRKELRIGVLQIY